MSEKLPSAEEVEGFIEHLGKLGHGQSVVLLRQFAALLRQMEASGSPQTDALNEKIAAKGVTLHYGSREYLQYLALSLDEVTDLCRHFERLSGAIRQATVEELPDKETMAIMDKYLTSQVVTFTPEWRKVIRFAIRALSAPKDRRKGQRRVDTECDAYIQGMRRTGLADRRQPK